MTETTIEGRPQENRRNLRRYWWVTLALLILAAIWLGPKVWRSAVAGQALLERQDEALRLLNNNPLEVRPDTLERLVVDSRQDILTLQQELGIFLPLTPYLGWVPKYGPLIELAPPLMEMADAGTETAVLLFDGLKPALDLMQQSGAGESLPLEELVPILAQARPQLGQASRSLDEFVTARQSIEDDDALPWRFRNLLTRADALLPLAQDGLLLAPVLPQLMGQDGPRTYLILAQNRDELRPSGGFISGAGILTIENGRILELDFLDTYQVDDWRNKPYDWPPQPLLDLMGLELFLFRDANFWPDFPTSAQTALDLYQYGQDSPPLDGVIAIDQQFLKLLIAATGPIVIESSGEVINKTNVIASLHSAWAIQDDQEVSDWIRDRKSFLGTFASAIRDKVETDFGAMDPLKLAKNTYRAIKGKHLQLYMRDPEVAAVLATLEWDGHLARAEDEDILAVIDTNVGFNKVNLLIDQRLSYEVTLADNGQATAELAIGYTNHAAVGDTVCRQAIPSYKEPPTYLDLANDCYWNFLRVYAPEGSKLLNASQPDFGPEAWLRPESTAHIAATQAELPGLATFTNLVIVPRHGDEDTQLNYQLPTVTTELSDGNRQYRLTVFKQAGTNPAAVDVTVNLPEGAQVVSALPEPVSINGRQVRFELELEMDIVITVIYQ